MQRRIKLGDKVKTLIERTELASHGLLTCPKGSIGMVIDDGHYPDVFIELKEK